MEDKTWLDLEAQDEPVNVFILINPWKSGYEVIIDAGEQVQLRGNINMSERDMERFNRQFRDEVSFITRENEEEYEPTEEELEEELYPLAKLGLDAFDRVFGNEKIRSAIEDWFVPGQVASIQIASEDFSLPWELMYPIDLEKPLRYENFWGMNFVIQRKITNIELKTKRKRLGNTIPVTPYPKVGLLTNNQ